MATPTSRPERMPKAPTTTIITRMTAVMTLFCRSDSMVVMSVDLSWLKPTFTPSGSSGAACSITVRTARMVSMMLAPMRLETSSVTAGSPFTRAKPVGSL